MWHLQSSSQISASSCPSTLSTNISFTKLGGSVSLFTFLVLSLKLGLRDLVRNVSSGVSTGTTICHCLRSCVAAVRISVIQEDTGRGLCGSRLEPSMGLAWLPRPEYRGTNTAHCSLNFLGSSDLPASVPRVAGAAAPCHYTRLTFVLFVETGFCHIAQAALKLLSLRPGCSSDPPTLASQGARITGMIHPSWFIFLKLGIIFLKQPQ
ncbi:uncharacterized protein LOC117075312 isoform X3 [Trachypithecus francoisi]|uniref:uncharacterized protein LOC117075312 isoform X3 n=1 Tax=Trachypithecus francoisi TaxID=54180 RepID=UPI00141BA4DE|nr:uncharacterized protein LOC117075312 isoform X3 [Trachypithecus francoisi]XP_033053458.1 uncharacterized protein LOC117075312 isoform X3 [Trachypithecus francoisi]XP_033053459.1 uncharacterized protein LOC117075312 isoform X3 [Trachypithecus francoisi]